MVEGTDKEERVNAAIPMESVPALTLDLEGLFRAHHARVLQAAYRITGNAGDAEDVLQTIFLRLLRREETPDLAPSPGAYLHRAAVNAAVDLLRRRQRQSSVPLESLADDLHAGTDEDPSEQQRAQELRRWLRSALARLGENAAEIFALSCFEGLGNTEIAEVMGMTPNAVGVVLHRVRRQLREELRHIEGQRS